LATKRNNPKRQTTTAPEITCARCKSERAREEHETPKPTAHKKSRTGNSNIQPTKREATTPKPANEPAATTATSEVEKTSKFLMTANVELRGCALLRSPA
jgi:hypothetical protein